MSSLDSRQNLKRVMAAVPNGYGFSISDKGNDMRAKGKKGKGAKNKRAKGQKSKRAKGQKGKGQNHKL